MNKKVASYITALKRKQRNESSEDNAPLLFWRLLSSVYIYLTQQFLKLGRNDDERRLACKILQLIYDGVNCFFPSFFFFYFTLSKRLFLAFFTFIQILCIVCKIAKKIAHCVKTLLLYFDNKGIENKRLKVVCHILEQ